MIPVTHNDLHALVRALTKSEKRFFKLQIAPHPKQQELGNLFDYFDKRAILQRSQEEFRPGVRSSQTDKYLLLYEQILKSQRLFYADSIVNFRIKDDIDNLHILYNKGQYKQCFKMLKPLKQTAYDNEKFHFALEILNIEKAMPPIFKNGDGKVAVLEEEERTFLLEENLSRYIALYAEIKHIIKRQLVEPFKLDYKGEYMRILNTPLLQEDGKTLSLKARLLRYKSLALCYTRLGDSANREQTIKECYVLLKQHPFLVTEMPRMYLEVYYNIIHYNLERGAYNESEAYLLEFEKIEPRIIQTSIDIASKYESYLLNSQLLLHTELKNTQLLEQIALQVERHLSEHQALISKDDYLVLLFNLINHYIFSGNFAKAKSYNTMMFSLSDKNSRWDAQHYGRLQQLIIFYELNHEPQLHYALNAIHKHHTGTTDVSMTEKLVLQCFTRLVDKADNSKKVFGELYEALNALIKDPHELRINRFYIDFVKYSKKKTEL